VYRSPTNYGKTFLKALLLVVMVFIGSKIFHRARRQSYLTMAGKALITLAIEQEIYFTTNFTYTSELTDLNMSDPEPLSVFLAATSDGWSAIAQHQNLPSEDGCVIYFGTGEILPVGNTTPRFPGDVACTP